MSGKLLALALVTGVAALSAQDTQGRTAEETERRIIQYVSCYGTAMKPGPWTVIVTKTAPGDTALARTIVTDPETMRATIRFNSELLKDEPDSLVRRVVIHEVAHLLSGELWLLAVDADTSRAILYAEYVAVRIESQPVWYTICPYKEEGR